MNSLAGALIVNKIIQEHSIEGFESILDPNKFPLDTQDEIEFIKNHVNTYHEVPSIVAFKTKFPEFKIISLEVTDTPAFLIKELADLHQATMLKTTLEQVSQLAVEGDLSQAIEVLSIESENIKRGGGFTTSVGTNIIKDQRRLERYIERTENKDAFGISTGFPGLDAITNGWHRGSLNVVGARINKGKSWMLLKFALEAWKQGERVLMYSGEMSEELVGYRFDTLYRGFNNFGLTGANEKFVDMNKYKQYFDDLSHRENQFEVVVPEDLGGMPTVSQIEECVIKSNPSVVIIDQISLMKAQKYTREERNKYSEIVRDLLELSKKYNLIVICASQVNRETAGTKDEMRIPEIHNLAESDGRPMPSINTVN